MSMGYLEAFNRKFEPEENDKLSENGVIAEKTMNTLLHVFEAYTELVPCDPRMQNSATDVCFGSWICSQTRFIIRELRRQEVFFDRTLEQSDLNLYSYGHDIETAWLMDRGL